jgi:DNA-binding HxlR family transcriptional regulator
MKATEAKLLDFLKKSAPPLRMEDLEDLCPGVNRRTLQRDLQGLIKRGVAKSTGAARAVRYRLKIKGL